jgi:hypothetical protein
MLHNKFIFQQQKSILSHMFKYICTQYTQNCGRNLKHDRQQ